MVVFMTIAMLGLFYGSLSTLIRSRGVNTSPPATHETVKRLPKNASDESVALSFYATNQFYFCAAVANAVIQNRCGSPTDTVIHYTGSTAWIRGSFLNSRTQLPSGAQLIVKQVPAQRSISHGYYRHSLDKFTAMHASGYNYTILMDSDQVILRDMQRLINRYLEFDVAAVSYNLGVPPVGESAPCTSVLGVLTTVVLTHNFPEITAVPSHASAATRNLPDGGVFKDFFMHKQYRKMAFPAEVMCYSYHNGSVHGITAQCNISFVLHFSYGGKPWAPKAVKLHHTLEPVRLAFGTSVRHCVHSGNIDLKQKSLLHALQHFPAFRMNCNAPGKEQRGNAN